MEATTDEPELVARAGRRPHERARKREWGQSGGAQGFSWDEVGEIHSMSGHAAEARFRRAIEDVQKRMMKAKTTASKKPADRIEELKPATQSDVKKQTTGI